MVCAPRGPPGFTLRAHPIRTLDATTPIRQRSSNSSIHRHAFIGKMRQGNWRAEQYWDAARFVK
jgi:hypothetical protein